MDEYRKAQLEIIVENIKRLRDKRGWTQIDLADETGFSLGSIKSIEAGARFPRPETLSAIGKALGVQPSDLLKSQDDNFNGIADRVFEKLKAVVQPQVVTVQIPAQIASHLQPIMDRLSRLDPNRDRVMITQIEQALEKYQGRRVALKKKSR